MGRFILLMFVGFGLLASPPQSAAQSDGPAILVADHIRFSDNKNLLVATGNVEIFYRDQRLVAKKISYDKRHNRVTVEGPLYLVDGEIFTLVADYAELSGDLRNGILRGARMVMYQQLQLSAVEINRIDGRYTQFYKTVASSCQICAERPTPIWQIRARRVIHDAQTRRLYFERAQFRLGNVPVAYFPRLSLPDPSVKRANGFLVPDISSSSTLGVGLKMPYFITLGDYADITLTPFLTSGGTVSLGAAFRRQFARGRLDVRGAITRDSLTSQSVRGFVFASGTARFAGGMVGRFDIKLASDKTYLSQYGESGLDRLDSSIGLTKVMKDQYFIAEIKGIHALRAGVSNYTNPYLLGGIAYRKQWRPTPLGGQWGIGLSSDGFVRRSKTDGAAGRDRGRLSAVLDWRHDRLLGNGVIVETRAELRGDATRVYDDTAFAQSVTRLIPVAALKLRWPLSKTTSNSVQTLEPVAQLVWSQSSPPVVPNEDSTLVEFDTSNLLSLNRFSGDDRFERGLRANIGVTYRRIAADGWNIAAAVGQVLRQSDQGQFAAASGLSGTTSDFVTAMAFYLPERFSLSSHTLFDQGLRVRKTETRMRYRADRFDVTGSHVWLDKDVAANTLAARSELGIDARITLKRNWKTSATLSYDIVTRTPSAAGLGLTYGNECIKIDFSLSRRFTSSTTIGASTSAGFRVALTGFGGNSDSSVGKRRCRAY